MNFLTAHAGVISEAPTFSEILYRVFTFLLSVAAVLAILALVIAGIRYFFVTSETGAKTIKQSLQNILLGLLVLFGLSIIMWQIARFLAS